jgi:hypothetical protein
MFLSCRRGHTKKTQLFFYKTLRIITSLILKKNFFAAPSSSFGPKQYGNNDVEKSSRFFVQSYLNECNKSFLFS